ncbi:MAG TPA: hypothetical protein GX739_05210 [Firmicutes bacterium]|nr:hypothetical protein [Bacillota bacterium]
MVRFLLFSMVLLILTMPSFLKTEYFIIDAIGDGVIRLEPLRGQSPAPSGEDCLYHKCQDNHSLAEGQVVNCLMAGDRILSIVPDLARTDQRKAEMKAIISRIGSTDRESD